MAFCPECGAEFGAGIRRCPECQVELIEELDDANVDEAQEENLVLIRQADSSEEAKRIKALLEENGILCVVEPPTKKTVTSSAGKMHVLVNRKDELRSQQLLENHSQ